jgi:hypothetical protein
VLLGDDNIITVALEGVEKHKKGGLNCVLEIKTFFLK